MSVPSPTGRENEWKEIIIDGLVVCHIYKREHENDPKLAIADLFKYEMEIALDRRVSTAARDLYANGRQQGRVETIAWCLPIGFILGFATCLYLAGRFS